jgi:hypothetical protein
LHVDDLRVAATEEVLADIHAKLFAKFDITTSDTERFLGMDTEYDLNTGILRMYMATYINSTVDRFRTFDVSQGVPYRELDGCLLWLVLCIMGPELLHVKKDLARRSNNFTVEDYQQALTVLARVEERKQMGIIYHRGGAGKETVPANTRLGGVVETEGKHISILLSARMDKFSTGDFAEMCELQEHDLYKLDLSIDDAGLVIPKIMAPTNKRFTVVAHSDASFAVGDTKQSITGFHVIINGTSLLWGSLKQTVVVDSTFSAEYSIFPFYSALKICLEITELGTYGNETIWIK